MSVTAQRIARADLRDFGGYASARTAQVDGDVWLNANEAAEGSLADPEAHCRRYPQPQPPQLCEALARYYRVKLEQLLATRGSDEGIDLLVRAFCPPGGGGIVIAPPVFGMYAICARLHGSPVIEMPARTTAEGWHSDLAAMGEAAMQHGARLVFVCSPGNPSGEAVPLQAIASLARQLEGQALLVLDAAYDEFADAPLSANTLLDAHENLVILRTLSKAHALAGARIGSLLADPTVLTIARRCQAPYPLAEPAVQQALAALQPDALAATAQRVQDCRQQRARMAAALASLPGVRKLWPSQGNFVLVDFDDAQAAFDALLDAGVVVRDMRAMPGCQNALRISIGSAAENARVLAALAGTEAEQAA